MKKIFNLLFYTIVIIKVGDAANNQVSAKKLCGDDKCSIPIAQGITLRNYHAPDAKIKISFDGGKEYKVISKPENENKNSLYEIEVSGTRGFASKSFLKETKVLVRKENLISVDIENYTKEPVKTPEVQSSISEIYEKVSSTSPLGNEPKTVSTEAHGYDTQSALLGGKVDISGTLLPVDYNSADEENGEINAGYEDFKKDNDVLNPSASLAEAVNSTGNNSINSTQSAESSGDLNTIVGNTSEIVSSEGNGNAAINVNQTTEVFLDKLNSTKNDLDVNKTVSSKIIMQTEYPIQKNLNDTEPEEKDVKAVENLSDSENNIKVDAVKGSPLNTTENTNSSVEQGNNYTEAEHVKQDNNAIDEKNDSNAQEGGFGKLPDTETVRHPNPIADTHIKTSISENRLEPTLTKENRTEIVDSKENNINVVEVNKGDKANNVTEEPKLIANPGENNDTKIEPSTPGTSLESSSSEENRTATVDLKEINENALQLEKEDKAKSVAEEPKLTGTVTQTNTDITTESSTSVNGEEFSSNNQNGIEVVESKKLNENPLEMIKENIENNVTEEAKLSNDLNRKAEGTGEDQLRASDENNNMYNTPGSISNVSKVEEMPPEENKSDEQNIKDEKNLANGVETTTGKESLDKVELEYIDDKSMAGTVKREDYPLESDHFTPSPEAKIATNEIHQDSRDNDVNNQDFHNPIINNVETGTSQPIVETAQNEDSSAEIIANSNEEKIEELLEFQSTDPKMEQPEFDNIESHKAESDERLLKDVQSIEIGDDNWMISKMLNIVNNFWPTSSKDNHENNDSFEETLNQLLHTNDKVKSTEPHETLPDEFCEKIGPNECPSTIKKDSKPISSYPMSKDSLEFCTSEKDFFSSLSDKVLEMIDLLACLLVTALTILIFVFGYYCICSSRKENTLLSKLNVVERNLLVSIKESAILKHELDETKNKLASIENNSFGTNDMVVALKKDLEDSEESRIKLQEQITSLEKELETAAEAGLELNKIVSELLSKSGDDSIIHTVEDLQKQLNEQQNTIFEINTTLAEKSRENSELQLLLNSHTTRFQDDMRSLETQNQELKNEKILLQEKIDETERAQEQQLSLVVEKHRAEISSLNREMSALRVDINEQQRKLQQSESRVQVLEECLNSFKNNKKFNIKDIVDAVNVKTEAIALSKERDSLRERLEGEMDARKLLEEHVKSIGGEVSKFQREYNEAEKQKVEAQTRLEVLSSYFKEKETQLQKELSLKEAMWLKQQGEASSTVERVRQMQDEIQSLKSQNDSLRAEIEAQAATHKAHIANLENRAHETWLAARQSERKWEEARSEGIALRRKLTALAGNPNSSDISQNRLQNSADGIQTDLNNAPSPVHLDSPNSPLMGGLPPHLPFLPHPPFMAPPHPFMPMPPPFMPPGEMRPPPLGRLMSPPPPPPDRYSPSLVDERRRYSPGNDRYTPDSRFNYNTDIMSYYDTETDFSPPPSPGPRSGGGNSGNYINRERDRDRDRNRGYNNYSPPPPRQNNSDRSKKSKGVLSSESADSFDSRKSKGKGKV